MRKNARGPCLALGAGPRTGLAQGQAPCPGQGGILGATPDPDHCPEPSAWLKCPDYLPALAMVSKVSVKIEIPSIALTS